MILLHTIIYNIANITFGYCDFLKILKIYIYNKNPSNPTIARIIEKPTPITKMIVPPFPPDDVPSFILNS